MTESVKKRSGKTVRFNKQKIQTAITKANKDVKSTDPTAKIMTREDILAVTEEVVSSLPDIKRVDIEDIQDRVEQVLMSKGFFAIAKSYILYRKKHQEQREATQKLMEQYRSILFTDASEDDSKRENANIDVNSPMGIMLKLGTEGAKVYANYYQLPEEFAVAEREGWWHKHDEDFSFITFNCLVGSTKLNVIHDDVITQVQFQDFDQYFKEVNPLVQCIDISDQEMYVNTDNGLTRVNKIMRRWHQGSLYRIELNNGTVIKCTEDHLFKLENTTEVINATQLQVGNRLPLQSPFPDTVHGLDEINLIDLISNNSIVIKNTQEIKKKYVKGKVKTQIYRILYGKVSSTQKTFSNAYSHQWTIEEYKMIRHLLNIDESELMLAWKKGRVTIPAILPLTKELGKFIGYVLSEGYVDDYGIVFANNNESLIQDFQKVVLSLFPEATITIRRKADAITTSGCDTVYVSGRIIAELFNGILASKQHSYDIRLPKWYFSTCDKFLQGLFIGEIDGDGSTDKHHLQIFSASFPFIKSLQELLFLKGIDSKVQTKYCQGEQFFVYNVQTVRNSDICVLYVSQEQYDKMKQWIPDSVKIQKHIETCIEHREQKVALNEIVSITVCDEFSGYVYDIETSNHYFAIDNVVVHNCLMQDLTKLFKNGFNTGHGYVREPNSIRSYAALACIAIQCAQNSCFGGQAVSGWDFAMAEGVRKSFRKTLKEQIRQWLFFVDKAYSATEMYDIMDQVEEHRCHYSDNTNRTWQEDFEKGVKEIRHALRPWSCIMEDATKIYLLTCEAVKEETHQAMEAAVHNFCTLHSRAGSQVPFSSINYGMDISNEGRLVIRELLNATWDGLGNGETPIFPIQIFVLKSGINYNPDDINYDLFQYSMKVSAKRLYPNYLSQDSTFNLPYYKPDDPRTFAATMGFSKNYSPSV